MARRKSMAAFRGLICMTDFLFTLSAGLLLLNYDGIVKPVASSVTQADPEAELKRLDRRIRMLESDAKEIANQLDQFLKHAHSGKTKVPDSGRSSSPQDGKPSVK